MALFWILVGAWVGSVTGFEWEGIGLGIFIAFLVSGDRRSDDENLDR